MIIIRTAREDEYDKVGELLSAAYAQYGPAPDDSPELVAAWYEYKTEIGDVRSRLDGSNLIVADVDGALLGTVTFYAPRPEPHPERWGSGYAAFRLLGVHPDGRGLGLGRRLTEWCIERSRELGATHVGLHTTHVMAIARAMYERMGFVRYPENDFRVTDDFTVEAFHLAL